LLVPLYGGYTFVGECWPCGQHTSAFFVKAIQLYSSCDVLLKTSLFRTRIFTI